MKKLLKLFVVGLIFTCLLTALFACGNKVAGLAEKDDWKSKPDIVQRGKEQAHAPIISYADPASAVKAERESSPYYLSLNGTWDFTLSTKTNYIPANFMKKDFVYPDPAAAAEQTTASDMQILYWGSINVPGSWELQGYDAPVYTNQKYPWGSDVTPPNVSDSYNPIGLYRREIDVPSEWNGREVFISLEGVQTACYIYVNGAMVGYGEDSYTTKDFRITPYIEYGKKNLIALKVIKYSDGAWLESQDSMKLGGIFRDIFLYSAPEIQIKDVFLDPNLDENYENALLQVGVDIASYKSAVKGYTLDIEVFDSEGKSFISNRALGTELIFEVNKTGGEFGYYLANGGGRVTATAPKKWDAENPNLYTAVISLKNEKGEIVDTTSQKFGFREAGFATDDEGNQIFILNGKPIKFYGVIYNEHDADTGATLTKEEMLADIKAMKSMNINAVRSPGKPLSSEFLDLCAQYGIYVIDDINIQTTPWANKGDQSIPGNQSIWQTAVLDRMINVIERDKNNPGVIMWSLGNQSGTGDNFTVMKNWLQQNEARLIIYDGSNVVSDITTAVNWDFNKLYEYVNNPENKKPIILQYFNKGLLNSAGNISSYVNFFTSFKNTQGGFFANWIDYAVWRPIQSENIIETLKTTPRSSNPELYELTYSGSWGESVSDSWQGLAGIMNADRTPQSDAEEFKRAFSPIYIKDINVKTENFLLQTVTPS
jgi:beta-galactosidase